MRVVFHSNNIYKKQCNLAFKSRYNLVMPRKISLLIVPIFSKALLCKHQKIHIQKRFMQRAGQAAKEKSKPSSDESINTKGFKKDINNNHNATLPMENVVKENSTTDYTASHYQTNTPKSQINSSEGKKNFDQMQQDSKRFPQKENPAENSPSNLNINPKFFKHNPLEEPNPIRENTTYEKFQRYTGTGAPLDNHNAPIVQTALNLSHTCSDQINENTHGSLIEIKMITASGEIKENIPKSMPSLEENDSRGFADEADCEHLLATPNGLIPVDASVANDPIAVDSKFRELSQERINVIDQPHVVKQMEQLEKRGLLKLHEKDGKGGYKPNMHFWRLFAKIEKTIISNNTKEISFNQEDLEKLLNNFDPQICLLKTDHDANEIKNVFLLPMQTHISIYQDIDENTRFVWSFLTSDQDKLNIIISLYKPFSGDTKEGPQLMHIFCPTVVNDCDLTEINEKTLEEAKEYLSRPEIKAKIKTLFAERVLPTLAGHRSYPIYNGVAVLPEDIDKVITEFDREQSGYAKTHFKKYYKAIFRDGETIDWLIEAKDKRPHQYPHIYQMVKGHHERHGYPSIEEYLEKHPYLIPNE